MTGYKQQEVAAPESEGSGWSLGITGTTRGTLTKVYHFYPGGEHRSVCTKHYTRNRKPRAKDSFLPGAEFCSSCEGWIKKHPNGGKRRSQ